MYNQRNYCQSIEMVGKNEMLNDHDDKHEGFDESEYHFSDEEVHYESEAEPTKTKESSLGAKENILAHLTKSRRLIISAVVFLILFFVAYKMVAPTPPPSTDIT